MSKEGGDVGQDRQVELWKVKKLIKSLQQARGSVIDECFIFVSLSLAKIRYIYHVDGRDFFNLHGISIRNWLHIGLEQA